MFEDIGAAAAATLKDAVDQENQTLVQDKVFSLLNLTQNYSYRLAEAIDSVNSAVFQQTQIGFDQQFFAEQKRAIEEATTKIEIQEIQKKINLKIMDIRKKYVKEHILKNQVENSKYLALLQEGYALIDIIHKQITGKDMTYHIGVTTGSSHVLYEGEITLSSILGMVELQGSSKNSTANNFLKLRFKRIRKMDLITNEQLGLKRVSDLQQSAYDKMIQISSNSPNLKNSKGKKRANAGNEYEAYRQKISKAMTGTDEEILNQVLKNTQSFAGQGDISWDDREESIKFFGKSPPSLASLYTIQQTVQNISSNLLNMIQVQPDAKSNNINIDYGNVAEMISADAQKAFDSLMKGF